MTFNFRRRRGVWRGRHGGVLARDALHHGSRGDRVRVGSGFRQCWLRPDHLAVLVVPLTGDGDVTGIAGCDGEQLAVSDINAAGGVARGPLKGAKSKVQCLDDQDSSAQDTSLAPAGGMPLPKPQWPVGARSYRATPYLPTLHHTCHPRSCPPFH